MNFLKGQVVNIPKKYTFSLFLVKIIVYGLITMKVILTRENRPNNQEAAGGGSFRAHSGVLLDVKGKMKEKD